MRSKRKIIATAIIKGGAGKTTTAAALAQAAQSAGKKVLAIDLDPQGNLTRFIGAEQDGGSLRLLHGEAAKSAVTATEQGIDIISSTPELATETTYTGSINRLTAALQPVKGYDLIMIDTPPQMGELTYNALQAATDLLIPLEADISSIQGLYQISDIAGQMKQSNPGLHVLGTIITRYDGRAKLNRYYYDTIAEKGDELRAPLLMAIRTGIAVKEAQAMQKSLFEYAPNSRPAQDYMQLYNLIFS